MLQYVLHNNILCVQGLREMIGKIQWDNLKRRSGLDVVIPQAPNRPATVTFESIRPDIQDMLREELGNPRAYTGQTERFIDTIKKDVEAFEFYSGKEGIIREKVLKLTNDASILNAITRLELQHQQMGKFNNDYLRIAINNSEAVNEIWINNLPWSQKRLKMKHEGYKKGKYESLIHRGTGNQNRRKVDDKLEELLMFFKCAPHKPYDKTVVEMYNNWLLGDSDYYDKDTGELLFDRTNYIRGDEYITVTEETVRKYAKMPHNAVKIDSVTMTFHDFNNAQRPIAMRDNNIMSNSKITLDDLDLPLADNGKRPKAYAAFDIGSQCCIGISFSDKKDEQLFENCILNMMRFVHKNGLGMPAEVEVENHLVKKYFSKLEKMFDFMRICAPTNSREKRAERRIGVVKYQHLKNEIVGVGRYYLRNKANRVDINRVNDEDIETMHPFKEVIAAYEKAIEKYNNSLHSNQELYKGMTRMQVYLQNQNPNLKPYENQVAAHYFGQYRSKPVNIYNNQYLKAANMEWVLPSPDLMQYFKDGKAYVNWIPELDGSVNEVYLYTNAGGGVSDVRDVTKERYMCTCKPVQRWKDAKIEQTDLDREIQLEQQKYTAQFDKKVKEGQEAFRRIATVYNNIEEDEAEVVQVDVAKNDVDSTNYDFDNENEFEDEYDYEYSSNAISDL